MRYQQWRLLLLRSYRHSHPSQVTSISTRSISSFLHLRSHIGAFQQSEQLCSLRSSVTSSDSLVKLLGRSFSSEPAIEEKPSSEGTVIDIFSRLSGEDEIRKELESSDIVISQDLALKILRKLESNPDVAQRVFKWVTDASPEGISSENYNTMLCILGGNGLVDEFWDLVDVMKNNGHDLSATVLDQVGEKFEKDGLESDLARLRNHFVSDSADDSAEKVCDRVREVVSEEEWSEDLEKRLMDLMHEVVSEEEWSEDLEKRLMDLKVEFHSHSVKRIVESLEVEPRKALMFFRWIDESGLFKHDEKTYNAMARVVGRAKFVDRFQIIVEEMSNAGYEVEKETYFEVSTRFILTKLIKEAVDLFEIVMAASDSSKKPTPECFCLLLKKIVSAKILDMHLFSRAVEAYTKNGEVLTDSMLKSVFGSLVSADRVGEITEVLKAMKKGGYIPSANMQRMIASCLSRKGKKDEADELVDFMEASENSLDDKAMASLVEGYCHSGELENALECFEKMVRKAGVSYADNAFEKLVLAYCNCNRNEARDAYKLFSAHVKQYQLRPRYSTYKILITNLLTKKHARHGGFEEALSLLPIMIDQGFKPLVEPFMTYLSKTGTGTEAYAFLKAMTSKKFPSTSVVLRVFETILKSPRHSEAHDLLSLCPRHIRNHPDVLELFSSVKPTESGVEKPLAAST